MIGGWTAPRGSRTDLGALLLGYYDGDRLRYAGKVGTGFTQATLRDLAARLAPLRRDRAPFADELRMKDATWVEPELVAQVGFSEWTPRRAAAPPALPRAARGQGRARRWCGSEPDREGGAPRGPGQQPRPRRVRRRRAHEARPRALLRGRRRRDGAARARPPAGAARVPQGRRRRGLLRQERAASLPRLDRHASTCPSARAARSTRSSPTTRRRSSTWPGRTRSRCTSGRAGRTASSARTACVFDLDPTVQDFAEVRAAAREAGELLRDIGLVPYTMTTGSRGLHVRRAAAARAPTTRRCTRSAGRWPIVSRPSTRTG